MEESIDQCLGKNWKQFTLLVIINGFVGGMAGLERTIYLRLPKLISISLPGRQYSHL